jgi:hypothetical protein
MRHRGDDVGRGARGEAEHVAQDDYGALLRWEVLQCGDEGEFYGLALSYTASGPAWKAGRLQGR